MDKIRVIGGRPLEGTVRISGAKNACLPDLCAALLTDQPLVLSNVPEVEDIQTMARVLGTLGAEVGLRVGGVVEVRAADLGSVEAPYDLVRKMRASILVLGPLLARKGHARVSLPGGCAIGARPVDLHLNALERMGAVVAVEHGYIEARAERLQGAQISFDTVTVTGTENVMMAACLADGETVLSNAACEPEVVDLAGLLAKMGARIEGAGSSTLRIQGVDKLGGARHAVIPDRIEVGTFIAACALAGGEIEVRDCHPPHVRAVIEKLRETGVRIEERVIRPANVKTLPYPGFPTDMQAQYMALMTQAAGVSTISESIFENRFMHVAELDRMGADVRLDGRTALVTGPTPLSGAQVMATDLRASACLVLAALASHGETVVNRVYHLDRGYYRIDEKLRGLGADIERLT